MRDAGQGRPRGVELLGLRSGGHQRAFSQEKAEHLETKTAVPQIRVLYRAIDQWQLDPRNPRTHRSSQIRQIARSIEAFGFNVPVLVDANGKVIAGHGRIMACQLLGRTQVPAISLHHPSDEQVRAFMLSSSGKAFETLEGGGGGKR